MLLYSFVSSLNKSVVIIVVMLYCGGRKVHYLDGSIDEKSS